ncbi:flagellar M-ring protein FliF [Massilia violaceinigra]|uniref:Flagellar M-ring protein n=1 Tax=Massilia violaceinigra TaxID=2045208 RepID=A0A2D2DH69_9BURK|nr:flagellar basal-body MS-ring/collar protein FliF [Massilia violaceinigra]ATQ74320.1 flagellar M-ring protein FliF [Massilia violaceinigra]
MQEKWEGLAPRARTGIVAGVLVIVALMAALGFWAYRTEYQVLFADIAPRDAAAMTSELDKMKTPYRLADGGHTILVPKELVYKTRLQLMGTDVPLHGAVGFEVFNNADFGMTEFVQKVNYQRATQGELTRTILSIDDIQAARVHLAIPEQGLFKKTMTKPKASVTLTMKPGRVLSAEQVAGIQRLVAASVPDIASADVTLLDQHGVALTRVANGENPGEGASSQLDAKRSTEDYLVKKVTQVLDRTFGAGQAIASVDVVLNLDQSKVTTEEVLPAKGAVSDGSPTGVMVRERYTVREGDAGANAPAAAKGGSGSTTSESDYNVGRRVEQLAVASGTVRRMTIAVVVRQALSDEQLARLKEVVSLAAGLNGGRGDAIVVNSMQTLVSASPAADVVPAASEPATAAPLPAKRGPDADSAAVVIGVLLVVLAIVLAAAALAWRASRRRAQPVRTALSDAERRAMLDNVRNWIDRPADAAPGPGAPR